MASKSVKDTAKLARNLAKAASASRKIVAPPAGERPAPYPAAPGPLTLRRMGL